MPAPTVPNSVLTASRAEQTAAPLAVLSGVLPPELAGHLYFVSPVGTVDTDGLPYPRATTIMNGDGMVVRVDFAGGAATFTSRLMRTWDQRADALTHASGNFFTQLLKFRPSGIARIGLLGARNFANTAFQPLKLAGQPTRMLVTYDAGRPWEMDPEALTAVTPVGARDEWAASAFDILPFPLFLSPAHPAFDPRTSEFVTVNYVRSIASLLGIGVSPLPALSVWSQMLVRLQLVGAADVRAKAREVRDTDLGRSIRQQLDARTRAATVDTSCRVLQWNQADGKLVATSVVLPDGTPVEIQQSVHQIALTKDHVVILDTGFKLGVAQLFNDPVPDDDSLEIFFRELLDKPQMNETIFYVVRRADLGKGVPAVAQKVVIPVEADHFVADYDETNGRITVHVAHAPATDLAEWWRPYDRQYYTKQEGSYAGGFLAVGAMDVGRLGRYEIDAATGAVVDQKTVVDDEKLWAISLYAGRDLGSTDPLPGRIKSLFWGTEGFFPELLTEYVYDQYKDYAYRVTPLTEIDAMNTQGGRPACIVRLDTQTMTLADSLVLPPSTMVSSLQFVPRPGSAPGSDDGWLLAVIFTDKAGMQLWILDAQNLQAAPCILGSKDLAVGFSLHTAWLSEAPAPRTVSYAVSLDEDVLPGDNEEVGEFVLNTLLPSLRGSP